jgi:hypothetical protein
MITSFARPFIRLGEEIQQVREIYILSVDDKGEMKLDADEEKQIKGHLEAILHLSERLSVPVSKTLSQTESMISRKMSVSLSY